MKKDINFPKVTDIAMAVVKEELEDSDHTWQVYLLNLKKEPIQGVLVAAKGYGEKDGEKVKTSTLRHFFETIPPESVASIEPLEQAVLGLSNEFWVSFYLGSTIYDKKYVFVAESITDDNLISLPLLDKKGVMIR